MPWETFFVLTVQILIWFVVLGFPIYLLVGSLAGAVMRGIGAVLMAGAKAAEDKKGKPIL